MFNVFKLFKYNLDFFKHPQLSIPLHATLNKYKNLNTRILFKFTSKMSSEGCK